MFKALQRESSIKQNLHSSVVEFLILDPGVPSSNPVVDLTNFKVLLIHLNLSVLEPRKRRLVNHNKHNKLFNCMKIELGEVR